MGGAARVAGGDIKWAGRPLFLSHVLAGEDVALEPIDDGLWLVRFAALPLAVFHQRRWVLRRPDSASPRFRRSPAMRDLLQWLDQQTVNHVFRQKCQPCVRQSTVGGGR